MQHLLAGAVWDHDGVRDDVRDYLVDHLADPAAVLVVDETGDLKKGASTVGVQRQYTGTAGKVDNAQVAVYLAYATDAGHGVIDRELYLPQGWLADPERCHAAGVPRPDRVCDQARAGQGDAGTCAGGRGAGRLGDRR
jgi:SRSO17 transposase